MMILSRIAIIYFVASLLVSCENKLKPKKDKSATLKIQFDPAFSERAEALLLNTDSSKSIQLLIRKNFRFDENEDTFYFKKIYLSEKQVGFLDSPLLNNCRIRIPVIEHGCCDGMDVTYSLMENGDTNRISFWSPYKHRDSIGYKIVASSFTQMRSIFQDSIITEYFDDLESYIDETKYDLLLKADRKINRLRSEKYSRN